MKNMTPAEADRFTNRIAAENEPDPARQPRPKDTFVIEDERGANWLLSKLAANRAEQERVNAQAATRTAELETDYNKLMHLYGQQLETFARAESERRRRKTVTLQQGTIAFRSAPARLVIPDVDDATNQARIYFPDCVTTETVTRLDKTAFIKAATAHMEATGEIVQGVERLPAAETFRISFGKAGSTE